MSGDAEITQVEGLVLRITPYSEASLILALLTREHGQLHFMLRGARRTGKKAFPEADLFRCLHILYRPSRQTELQTARQVESVRNFDNIAHFPAQYRAAGWLCRLALENSVPNQSAPLLYEATIVAFDRLARAEAPCGPVILSVCFAALEEHGLLPDLTQRPESERHMRELLSFAYDLRQALPEHEVEVWRALRRWMFRYLLRVGLHVPTGWNTLPE